MTPTRRRSWSFLAVILCWLVAAVAHAETSDPNGIFVGKPKLYDARALYLMLEELEKQMARLEVVQQEPLLEALSLLQGQQTRQFAVAGSISALPLPATEILSEAGDGEELTPTSSTETTSAFTPQAPSLPSVPAASTFQPGFGLQSQDLLEDQVNLSYRIFSLRLLLQRALSDRLLPDGKPRQQAILGLPASLVPPKSARGRAAFVEVTIVPKCKTAKPCAQRPMEVVALLPQEKTYNASRVSTKSMAFGGSPITSVFSLGVNVEKKNQVFYLYRDTDTLTIPRLPNPSDVDGAAVTFGWQFRPVLGRESVAAGPRQLMAVLALAQADEGKDSGFLDLEVRVRTYWKKYDDKSQTTRSREESSVGPEQVGKVEAWKSGWFEQRLTPEVESIEWSVTGPDSALVTIRGLNFLSDTRILMGGRSIDQGSGLVLKSDQTMELTTSLHSLATEDGFISGRFGASVDLARNMAALKNLAGIAINSIEVPSTEGRTTVPVALVIQEREGRDLPLPMGFRPIISVGDRAIPGPYKPTTVSCRAGDLTQAYPVPQDRLCQQIIVSVPTQWLQREAMISVRYPFLGREWTTAEPFYQPTTRIVRLGGENVIRLAIRGPYFDEGTWTAILDRKYTGAEGPTWENKTTLLFDVPKDVLKQYRYLTLISPRVVLADGSSLEPYLEHLPIPPAETPSTKPSLKAGQVVPVAKDSAVGATFQGENLRKITKAFFGNEELRARADAKGGRLTVFLTRKVTEKPGLVDLILQEEGGVELVARIAVQP